MELTDYFNVIKRRAWILLLIPIVAGALTAFLLSRKPEEFATKATVVLSGLNEGSAADVKQYIADFRGAANTTAVLDPVAQTTGVPVGRLQDRITTSQQGDSSVVNMGVTFQAENKAKGPDVLRETAQGALGILNRANVEVAQRNFDTAKSARDTTTKALDDFTKQIGIVDVPSVYSQVLQETSDLRVRLAEARALGVEGEAQAASLQKDVEARESLLTVAGPNVERYKQLEEERTAANQAFIDASRRLAVVQSQQAATESPTVITVGTPQSKGRTSGIIQRSIAAAVAGLVLAVGVVFVLEILASERRRRAMADASAARSSAAAPAPDLVTQR